MIFHSDWDYRYFWMWTQFADYCYFLALFLAVGSAIMFLFARFTIFVELVGFASLLLEACLGVPQFWRNYNNKSTEGMRYPTISYTNLIPMLALLLCKSA